MNVSILSECEDAIFCSDNGRQFSKLFCKCSGSFAISEKFTFNLIPLFCFSNIHSYRPHALQQILIPFLEHDRIGLDTERLSLVHQRLFKATYCIVLNIEFQVFHGIMCQDARLKDLHLVLYTGRVGHKTNILHICQHLISWRTTTITFIVFYQHLCGHLIVWCGIAQIYECGTSTDKQRQQKPLPVEDQHSE